ncbi:hypothetical protein METBIDRAFT_31746 [Metschnikowia bicuspidata var. bicuspidata NRRL YB-4993]|uniref:Rab-GAP TBC domain-containing protein n=1 Tax=Metschnikowia bicuspidata var. bicuspidata NRRL YB-4993 TaxID=869754 RepID=A0A1A0HAJ2_9ASCO|nr:hypothetical protein METBIDRAFT_31746 [Metschnikowia bicuspidata var. bicuspidata NRRL YB-4993]OBA21149.1 hypothetical protein METBIDRAFT_31746 [Metschnikowia bicuspidata var. bicuspidata NRRL YB-4993]
MFSESLLEFEESLAEMSVSSNSIMLNNLDLKADLNRFSVASSPDRAVSETTIAEIFAQYDYSSDEVTLCTDCRSKLSESKSSCCSAYIDTVSSLTSSVELDYWRSFVTNPYKTLLAVPNYSKVAFFQKGVPFQLRPLVWQKLILVNQKNLTGIPDEAKVLFKNFQHSYDRDISSQIKKDLARTFPNMRFFQEKDTVDSLLTILNVYANYDLDLGYCQGLLFLVGTLFYLLRDREATFHSWCKIMECEPELRSIFVPTTMASTLDKWYFEFMVMLSSVDAELANHLKLFCDCKVFLYQWWLSGTLIHAPDFTVNNRIVDFCLVEGWKVGIFKISMGLLLCNRPILMSFGHGDEEVVYQHLLNESKWGHIINNSTAFFGDMLLSIDESLFMESVYDTVPQVVTPKKKSPHKRNGSSVLGMLKNLAVSSSSSDGEGALNTTSHSLSTDSFVPNESRSQMSLFSSPKDTESIYSNATSLSWDRLMKHGGRSTSFSDSGSIKATMEDLTLENQELKLLLRRAYAHLDNDELKRDIGSVISM